MHRIAPIARAQYGVFGLSQALEVGIPERTVREWAAAGRIEVAHPSVYLINGAPDSYERRVIAATIAAGPGAFASHRTASRFWGWLNDPFVEVSVGRSRLPRLDGVIVHRSRDLSARWTKTWLGIPTTTPARTLVDLGAVARPWRVEDALERAVIARQVTVEQLEATYDLLKRRGRDGTGVLRRVLDDRALGASRPDSMLEVYLGRLLRDHGLPMPTFQYEIWHDGLLIARADAAYVDRKIDLEVDGWAYHATPKALQRGFDRDDDLDAIGWTVKHFSWRDVVREPSKVAARIRRLLGADSAASRRIRTQNGEESLTGRGPSRTGR